ncbi:MAG TPA: restriction endonuclease [Thermoanaerobaculia bacterium]|nr:restriction endonuclease [Thermoanaerobaculia bacterium]
MTIDFTLHPNVYATGEPKGLVDMLERVWVRGKPGDGTLYVLSGFGNYNGAVRFLDTFARHIGAGGEVISFFAGSTGQSLTSKQLVTSMLKVGAVVNVVNRKRLLHAKCYGASRTKGESLIVSSGNFTGPGMGLNVESSVLISDQALKQAGFSWANAVNSLLDQAWDIYQPTLDNQTTPAWKLLYDEYERDLVLDESEESTLLILLGHSDTARIQAARGSPAGKGTQYFWLSKDSVGFFPPLTIRNQRGYKATFSCLISLHYVDLGIAAEARVTLEAENNVDFRLGTARLRYTRLAKSGDIAALSRVGEREYELRIVAAGTPKHARVFSHMVNFIGHQGKRYGFVDNAEFSALIGVPVGRLRADVRGGRLAFPR